jgi:hypothetical protein
VACPATHPRTDTEYERHRPEETVLFKTLQAHWRTFISELETGADPPVLPAFVLSEVEAFLRCGILAHGLVLAKFATAAGVDPSRSPAAAAVFAPAALDGACATSRRTSWTA